MDITNIFFLCYDVSFSRNNIKMENININNVNKRVIRNKPVLEEST